MARSSCVPETLTVWLHLVAWLLQVVDSFDRSVIFFSLEVVFERSRVGCVRVPVHVLR